MRDSSSDVSFVSARGLKATGTDPPGILMIGTFVAYRIGELGLHGWDIRASVGPPAGIHSELCPFLLEMVRQGQTRFCRPDGNQAGGCRFELGRSDLDRARREGKSRQSDRLQCRYCHPD